MIIIMSSQAGIYPPLSVGQCYLVNYGGAIFLGEVTKSVGNETEVKVMTKTVKMAQKTGSGQKMRIMYFTERKTFIMKFICPPIPIGCRGTLKFESS